MCLNEFLGNGLSYPVHINFTFREENVEMPSRSCREQRGIHSTWRWEKVVPRSLGRHILTQLTWGAGYIRAWIMGEATQHLGHRSFKLSSLSAVLLTCFPSSTLPAQHRFLLPPMGLRIVPDPENTLNATGSLSPEQEMLSEAVNVRLTLLSDSQGGALYFSAFSCVIATWAVIRGNAAMSVCVILEVYYFGLSF